MGDYVVFQMWRGYRESLIRAHQFYVDQAKARLLTQFTNISAEADKAAAGWLSERSQRFFDPDRHDPSELYEGAEDADIEFYQLLTEMQERTRISVIAGFFHEWEKKLRQWLVDQIKHWHRGNFTKERIWKATLEELYELLESFGWELKTTPWFSALDACGLVVNVHKHGDGPSLAALKTAHPRFLVHPLAGTGVELHPLWDKLTHEHLQVSDADLECFADAISSFWREMPEDVFDSQVILPPSWFVKAIEKDQASMGNGMTRSNYTPGGDAKIIAEIAKARFGGFVQMFEHHGWPERGSDMMRKVQTRVVETYGSVRAFEAHFAAEGQK